MTTVTLQLQAATAQLELVLAQFDARLQTQRGHESHVPIETDAELRRRVEIALGRLGGSQ